MHSHCNHNCLLFLSLSKNADKCIILSYSEARTGHFILKDLPNGKFFPSLALERRFIIKTELSSFYPLTGVSLFELSSFAGLAMADDACCDILMLLLSFISRNFNNFMFKVFNEWRGSATSYGCGLVLLHLISIFFCISYFQLLKFIHNKIKRNRKK